LTAGILHALGIPMGDRLAPADEWNQAGYFEDMDFVEALNDLLDGATAENGLLVRCRQEPWDRFQQLVASRNSTHDEWGLKNFNLVYILPTFTALCGTTVRLLRVDRSFAEAVSNWQRRNPGRDREVLLEQAHLLYNLDMIYSRHPGPKMRVSFHDLLESPECEVIEIAEWLGIPYRPEAAGLVRKELKHF
jgi:hypothetical protein